MPIKTCFIFLLTVISGHFSPAQQVLTLQKAIEIAVQNYGTIKAKNAYAQASAAGVDQARSENVPNVNLGIQQDFGTINGQNGPLYGFGGLGVASSGAPLPQQNWNAAFGALYLTNINWDFFAFGKAKERVKVARSVAERDNKDLNQEIFQHKIRVTAAYLTLQAAHQLTYSYQKNLERADTIRRIVTTRAINGLVAGVDSSLASADYANAVIVLTRAKDLEQEKNSQLAQLMGIEPGNFSLDSTFILRVPAILQDNIDIGTHPLLQWYKSRMLVSEAQSRYLKTLYYPSFSLVAILQTRGSGFGNGYAIDQHDFSKNYWNGIKPTRVNYLFGVGVTWNIAQPFRLSKQVRSQDLVSKGLQEEYAWASQQIKAQLQLSAIKIRNAITVYRQAPVQVQAARDVFTQRSVLYLNGLTNLVDLSQAMYVLVRAETDRDIAYNNIWQALLLKAAAAGDYSLFENQ